MTPCGSHVCDSWHQANAALPEGMPSTFLTHNGVQPCRPVVWSIAGSDSGGGAGIQADLRAFNLFDVHGCTAIAAITAQNSLAVERIEAVSPDMLEAQLTTLARDMPPKVIKTGMLASVENVRVVARWVDRLRAEHPECPVALVVDPICRASTGARLADADLRQTVLEELLPRATLVKPNRAEALWLSSGVEIASLADSALSNDRIPELARSLRALGARAVVITGGDAGNDSSGWASDWMDTPQTCGWLGLPRATSTTTHGTGCTFTAAAAAAMALGFCEADAIILAKMTTTSAIRQGYGAGAGAGVACAARDFSLHPELLPYLGAENDANILLVEKGKEPFKRLVQDWMGLYPIVDSADWVGRMIGAGAKTIQLRVKPEGKQAIHAGALSEQVRQSVALTRAAGVQFFVNDHWKLALQYGAYGVHLGQEDLATADLDAIRAAGLRLGVSTQSLWEVCRARAVKPSYIACGPIYETQTKQLPWLPQGEDNLAYWCAMVSEPVVAIAGMNAQRGQLAVRCGAQGIAVVSAITQAADPQVVASEMSQALEEARAMPRLAYPRLPHTTLA